MSALTDAIAASNPRPEPTPVRTKAVHPKGWEPGSSEFVNGTGYVNLGALDAPPPSTTWDAYLTDAGMTPPSDFEVIEPVGFRSWDALKATIDPKTNMRVNEVARMHYYRLNVRRRASAIAPDLRQLFASAKTARKTAKATAPRPENATTATVVMWADPQTGKVASRGGTPELIERIDRYLGLLEDYTKQHKSDIAYFFDLGDSIEGFENTAGQMGTNDLSLMDQIDASTTIELEAIKLLARTHSQVIVAGIGSNHCRWRQGKGQLGFSGDDRGIYILKQLKRALAMNPEKYGHVSVIWPDRHEETMALDVVGTIIGLAHGHQAANPDAVVKWWLAQSHGGQPIADADILCTGHYHSFQVKPSGRNKVTGKSKWWFQASTLDNGSDWYRYRSGSDSEPGLPVFTVGADGWDNLRILS